MKLLLAALLILVPVIANAKSKVTVCTTTVTTWSGTTKTTCRIK